MIFRNSILLEKWIQFEEIVFVLTICILAIYNYFLNIFSLKN
jgi:hypothetical protein